MVIPSPRLRHTPSAEHMGGFGHVPIRIYSKPSKSGLKFVLAWQTNLMFKITSMVMSILHLDSLWLSSTMLQMQTIPGWCNIRPCSNATH